jgi:hypothetical protein
MIKSSKLQTFYFFVKLNQFQLQVKLQLKKLKILKTKVSQNFIRHWAHGKLSHLHQLLSKKLITIFILFFPLSLVCSLPALFFSVKAKDCIVEGNVMEARENASLSFKLNIIATLCWIIGFIIAASIIIVYMVRIGNTNVG